MLSTATETDWICEAVDGSQVSTLSPAVVQEVGTLQAPLQDDRGAST